MNVLVGALKVRVRRQGVGVFQILARHSRDENTSGVLSHAIA